MTLFPTPAWPPPRACNSDGTLQGPPPSQATRCPLETTSTLRRVHSASSMCRIFSPCTDLPLAPHTPFPASLCPSPSPRSLQLSNSQPRHHVSQPAPPSTQHRFTPSVQSQVCSSCLTPLSPSASKLSNPPTALDQLPSSPASTCICPSFHSHNDLRHKYNQLLPKAFSK